MAWSYWMELSIWKVLDDFCRPESLGLVTGIVFMVVTILFQHFIFSPENNISDHYPPENAVCDYFQPFLR